MRWFQTDSDTPNDPRIKAVLRALGPAGFGGLVLLWCHIANHGEKRPGYSLDTAGRPIPKDDLVEASMLTAEQFDQLVRILVENGHFVKREWEQRQVIAIPAMARRADTYTKRSVRTLVKQSAKSVPLQDTTNTTLHTKKKERGLRPPVAPADNLKVITRLCAEIRKEFPNGRFADLKDFVKGRCAQLDIAYDAEVVGKALESAMSPRLASVGGFTHVAG